jgi:hypothetical protein
VTAYLFTGKRFMCGEYLCRHRIVPRNKSALPWGIRGERGGIPHLAKNERDMGHPARGAGLEPKSAFVPSSTCYRQASLLKSETLW